MFIIRGEDSRVWTGNGWSFNEEEAFISDTLGKAEASLEALIYNEGEEAYIESVSSESPFKWTVDDFKGLNPDIIRMGETVGLRIRVLGEKDGVISIKVNGREYGYKPEGIEVDEFLPRFVGIMQFSAGKALAWAKNNSSVARSPRNEAVSGEIGALLCTNCEAEITVKGEFYSRNRVSCPDCNSQMVFESNDGCPLCGYKKVVSSGSRSIHCPQCAYDGPSTISSSYQKVFGEE